MVLEAAGAHIPHRPVIGDFVEGVGAEYTAAIGELLCAIQDGKNGASESRTDCSRRLSS